MTETNFTSIDKEREEMHRKMLSSVSHDLKTPLASVIGSLEIHERMKDKLPTETRDQLIATALHEAYRLDSFVTNILEMARLEENAIAPRIETCSVRHLIQDCLTKLGHRLHSVNVTINGDPSINMIETDPILLTRIIIQLVDNAIRFADNDPKLTVAYGRLEDNSKAFYLTVQDNGPGIAQGKEEAIFTKYARFARSDSQKAGTGLGLSIVREIARLLKGTIKAENNPQGGAVFTLILPNT